MKIDYEYKIKCSYYKCKVDNIIGKEVVALIWMEQ